MHVYLPGSNQATSVGKILCIGRNYARHAAELGNRVPEAPMVFLKPSSALVDSGGSVRIPTMSKEVHHELEVVVAIGDVGSEIPEEKAMGFVAGYALGLDMTARDVQQAAKEAGAPWSVAKGFDTFAPLGAFVAPSEIPNPSDIHLELTINGESRQSGTTADMIFQIPKLISWCSSIFTLYPGDLIYTGTPEGVGPVHRGDLLEATGSGLHSLSVTIT